MNNKCLISIFLILLSSCKDKDNNELGIIFNNFKTIECYNLELEETLGRPSGLNIIDDYLIYADIIEENILTFYDTTKDKIVKRAFTKGQGPNDILMPIRVGINKQNKSIYILQRQNGLYREYDLTELLNNNNVDAICYFNFPNADYIKKSRFGYITGNMHYENGSIAMYDKTGALKSTANVYPEYFNVMTNVSNKYRIGQGPIGYIESSTLVFASLFTGEIKFYHINDNDYSIIPIESYYIKTTSSDFKSRVENEPQNTPILETDIEHFTEIYTTNEYVYILYSGETMVSRINNNTKHSYILKFDIEGKPVECYKTNRKLLNMCISDDNTVVYGISLSDDLDYIITKAVL